MSFNYKYKLAAVIAITAFTAAAAPASLPSFAQLAATMVGHWSCSSTTAGKTTTYTTDFAVVPNSKWIRGINRTPTSTSEDMETYDPATRQWKIIDMEPNGSSSVLIGTTAQIGHVAVRSVYPDATQYVRYDRVSDDAYTLTFDFLIKGKHVRWLDTCRRG